VDNVVSKETGASSNEDASTAYTAGKDAIVQVTGLVGTHTATDFLA
jgi:hypothetical protein